MNTSTLNIAIKVDDKGSVKIERLGKTVKTTGKKGETSFNRMKRSLKDFHGQAGGTSSLIAGIGTAMAGYFTLQAAGNVLAMADNYTLLNSRLQLVTESSGELETVQQKLYDISQDTGTSYSVNAASYASLAMSMKSVGASSKEMLAISDLVNKSLVVSGATAEETSSFMLQFKQAMGSGVLQGEEFRAMMEANSYFGAQLAEALDTDIAGLRKMSKQGKLTTDVLRKAFPEMAEDINQAFDKIPLSIGRAMTKIENAFGKVISEANSTADGTSGVALAIDDLAQVVEQNQDSIGALFVGITATASGAVKTVSFLVGVFNAGASSLLALAGAEFRVIQGLAAMTDKLHITSNAAEKWKLNAEAAFGASEELIGKSADAFARMSGEIEKAATAQQKLETSVEKTGQAVDKQGKGQGKITKEITSQLKLLVKEEEQAAEDREAAVDEMYTEAGLGADEYFNNEATKLVEKAAKWEASGADTLKVEEWLYDELGKLSETAWERGEEAAGQYMDVLQTESRTLVDEFNTVTGTINEQMEETALKVAELDGSNIHLTASFDGSAAMAGYDALIAKMRALQEAAARSSSSSSGRDSRSDSSAGDDSERSSSRFAARTSGNTTYNQAAATTNSNNVTVNISQRVSRSDVANIVSEQHRRARRS